MGDHLLDVLLPGVLWISSSSWGRSPSKVIKLGLVRSPVLGDSLWSSTSICTPELVPRRVLELMGEFRRDKDSISRSGRTDLIGGVVSCNMGPV